MRLLVLTGNLLPVPGNNANLLFKLLPFLAKAHEVRVLSVTVYESIDQMPSVYNGFPVYWIKRSSVSATKNKLVFPLIAKLMDPNGNSDAINVLYIKEALRSIKKSFPFDAVVSASEPYPAASAAAFVKAIRVLYLMDPPEAVRDESGTKFRNRSLNRILSSQDAILTTPFIKDALISKGMNAFSGKIIPLGFPMIEKHGNNSSKKEDRFQLLFSGWLCSQLRSPQYFLDIVSRLDERFEVTFMGKECELLCDRFPIETKAKLVTLPNQPYETALQAMADSDIMINIGNSVPVHMPSKTLEYINTGKPFVNFYKMDDCPTLYYTKRYPLCLNLSEKDPDIDAAAERFIDFCVTNKGKTVDRDYIVREYEDCTPEYIAHKILDVLGE